MSQAARYFAIRLALAYAFGDSLSKRVELNSTIYSLINLKEAAFWSSIGRSPYTGSSFRGPPLLLLVFEWTSEHHLVQAAALGILDWLASQLLQSISVSLLKSHPDSAASSAASLANLTVIASLHGALQGNAAVAGLSIAAAVYLSPHSLILLVPLTLLLSRAGENADAPTARMDSPNTAVKHSAVKQNHLQAAQLLLLYFGSFLACLLLLSDIQLHHYPEHCRTSFMHFILPCQKLAPKRPAGAGAPVHWIRHVYGYMIWAPDTSPNIGMWWYFFAEVFPSWRAPFKGVFITVWAVPPLLLAKKLYKDPLLLFTCYCIVISLLKPHPTAADGAMFMALLPFFPHLLCRLPSGVFTATSLLILASLSPAMWHLWMDLESANANFFYAVTLLWAAWQVMLLLQLVTAAIQHSSEEQQTAPQPRSLQQKTQLQDKKLDDQVGASSMTLTTVR